MEKSVFGSVRGLMIAMALSAMVIFGCALFASDDSFAANSGDIIDQNSHVIGSFEYAAPKLTLTLTAESDTDVTYIRLDDFGNESNVTGVTFKEFSKDFRNSFTPETGYTKENITFEYGGTIKSGTKSVGKWTFIPGDGSLSLVADSQSNVTTISFNFNMKESVRTIDIKLFTKDLIGGAFPSIALSDYNNLEGISYIGDIKNSSNAVTGRWTYVPVTEKQYFADQKRLTLECTTTSTGLVDYANNSSSPFKGYYFETEAESIHILGYTSGGNYLFSGFSNVTHYYSKDYSSSGSPYKFYGLTSLTDIRADGIINAYSNFLGISNVPSLKTTLKHLSLPNCKAVHNYSSFAELSALVSVDLSSVTSLNENYTFKNCTSLNEIKMPFVTNIGHQAFYGCVSLEEMSLQNLTTLSSYAFYGCTSLKTVNFPSLATVSNNTFEGCSVLTDVVISSSTSIGSDAFKNCMSLERVTVGNNVAVGNYAFYNCSRLNTINVENIISLGYQAFYMCTSLNGERTFTNLKTIYSNNDSNSSFKGCGIEALIMPKLEDLPSCAFYGSQSLVRVEIGSSCAKIGASAFYNCSNLGSVSLGSGTSIGNSAFYGCGSLKSIVLPDSVEKIGDSAFRMSGLESIDTKNVVSIEQNAFTSCTNLSDIVFGSNLETIGNSAFTTTAIRCELIFHEKLTSIGSSAFSNTTVPSIKFSSSDSASKTELGNNVFDNCDSLTSVDFGKQVSVIPYRAFYGCNLLKDVTLNSASVVTTIGNEAFQGCNILESEIEFPSCLQSLGTSCFSGTAIKKVIFSPGTTVESIPSHAFYSCTSLIYVNIPAFVTLINTNAF
ncbi:MAG: leucine-rich repeat protein, partial [Candidatus Methanomethylophilaceae archaeon]|nr:leucine-rich repeat protein [Candidatus Methanomethylophilaceae archaeon]